MQEHFDKLGTPESAFTPEGSAATEGHAFRLSVIAPYSAHVSSVALMKLLSGTQLLRVLRMHHGPALRAANIICRFFQVGSEDQTSPHRMLARSWN